MARVVSIVCLAAVAALAAGFVKVERIEDAVPGKMNLQGFLTDAGGNPVEGTRAMIFRIYRDNVMQWEESQDVSVRAGLFAAELGSLTPIPGVIFGSGSSHELELLVTGQALSPRVPISSNAFSFRTGGIDRPITPALAEAEIADGAVGMAKIAQSGASTGQVIKWTGSAWAPRDDSAGGGSGGGVTSVSQARGVVCTPNPITATGSVRLDTAYSDGRYIVNQADAEQDANFMLSGAGQASQFTGISSQADAPGIYGSGGTYCSGTYGESEASDWAGVTGTNEQTDGVGVVGFGQFAGAAGQVDYADGCGLFGANLDASGTGAIGAGNGEAGQYLLEGSGGAFTGTVIGAFGYCANSSGDRGGGYFAEPNGGFAWVAANVGGDDYKIGGAGLVATTISTRAGDKSLFAPEMPEPWFEDCGRARLSSGHCRVELEPLFSDCITVDAAHPLAVFVQANEECNGVYVKTDTRGFDVYELSQGRSNAEFSFRVLGHWKGHENLRFPDGLRRLEHAPVRALKARADAKQK